MFEIIRVKPRNKRCLNKEEVLHAYYYNGDILIKTEKDKWYITDGGTHPPIIWKKIIDPKILWDQANTVEELIIHWEMENVSDKIRIKGVIEVWYDDGSC